MEFKIKKFILKSSNSNTYLIQSEVDEKSCYLIDAGNGIEAINAIQPNQNIDYKAMSTEEVAAKIKVWGDKSQLLMAEARKAASEADYNEKTMDDRVIEAIS